MIKRIEKVTDKITLYNCDCMDLLKQTPDKYYSLALVDPPYGLGKRLAHGSKDKKNSQSKFTDDFYKKNWDNEVPSKEYFDELFRVSKNQIIWGGNYFELPPSRCIICWDKMVYIPSMSQIEFAWTSFDLLPKLIQINNTDKNRIHLTQKPVKLYEWLLKHYAKPTDKILDTHFGSCSIGIACHNYGCSLDACELDEEYFNKALERLKVHVSQLSLF